MVCATKKCEMTELFEVGKDVQLVALLAVRINCLYAIRMLVVAFVCIAVWGSITPVSESTRTEYFN